MINMKRLSSNLEDLSKIGRNPNGGMNRFSFTDEEKEANKLVEQYMEEAGLSVYYDAVGNLIGSMDGAENLPVILLGSHIDTVPDGGKYDGALGVLSAIEVMHTIKENGIQLKHPVRVISFKDEEGSRFGYGMIGSRTVAGTLKAEDLLREDDSGISIQQAMKNFGLKERPLESAKLVNVKAYLEIHIEQGKVLESNHVGVGNVTGIAGPLWLKFHLKGLAEHAGATPMNQRHDALTAASLIIAETEKIAKQFPPAVATVGKMTIKPNGVNVIPGEVEWTIDIRSIDESQRNNIEQMIKQFAGKITTKRELELQVSELQRIAPVQCDEDIQTAIQESIREIGEEVVSLPSGAGHDGMQFKDRFPVGMIFVKSVDGISHNPKELSLEKDIEKGSNVLYHTLLRVDGTSGDSKSI
ncbi:Zn-dependent hydrolase [Virgibacillus profundi]|uniref:Zn-dependent hydrolase n=1 Tax=Virgibacillus profundi TaxID=2024555 RepID=A0A2A2IA32_9BACI|nr:Zn-dependent hydrolase [Virgibacillus profundi]PAV27980.1 Zn-dependent hydrolase [Virgibacillus profundi]PXY52158.1 Zn-dependent hydrolase [Virgibacillus profundi]